MLASWSSLGAVYSAPEGGQLLTSMDPVGVDAHTIESNLSTISGPLDTLADEVAAPVRRLKELKIEAEEFVASVRGGVTVDYYDPDNTLMQANAMLSATTGARCPQKRSQPNSSRQRRASPGVRSARLIVPVQSRWVTG